MMIVVNVHFTVTCEIGDPERLRGGSYRIICCQSIEIRFTIHKHHLYQSGSMISKIR